MKQDELHSQTAPEDRAVIDLIAADYSPPPMTAIGRAAFRRSLSDRMTQRTRARWAFGFATAAAAAAALVLVIRWQPASTDQTAAMDTPLLYAYVDPDEYSPDSQEYLPADYRVLAVALDDEPGTSRR